eukprot:4135361-Prymnesium_polylepis.1
METARLHAYQWPPLAWPAHPLVCVYQRQRCRAGGQRQRQAGEHRAEPLRRPPRRRSGAAPPC